MLVENLIEQRLAGREMPRDIDLEHEQRDRDREHTVAERDDARELESPLVAMAGLARPQAADAL